MELIIASNNKGKVKEYKDIFEALGYEVFSQGEKNIQLEVEETGTTFEENAVLKAQAIYDLTHSCVISDDSGLEVEALNNEPGIYSARYKGLETEHDRRMAIIDGLINKENRKARFITCICFIDEAGEKQLFKGIWNGTIAYEEKGTNGFGYDPIFISEDADGKTTASLPITFKETYSHRAKAVKLLMDYLYSRGKNMIGFCGVNCKECTDFTSKKCLGCKNESGVGDESCFFVKCNKKHTVSSCGSCELFPCEDIVEFSKESESHKQAFERLEKMNKTI